MKAFLQAATVMMNPTLGMSAYESQSIRDCDTAKEMAEPRPLYSRHAPFLVPAASSYPDSYPEGHIRTRERGEKNGSVRLGESAQLRRYRSYSGLRMGCIFLITLGYAYLYFYALR